MKIALLVLPTLLLAACSGGSGDGGTDGGTTADGTVAQQFKPLISGQWSLAPASESHICVRKTLTEEIYVSAFHPIIPTGTHHTVLTITDGSQPDGTGPCGNTMDGPTMIFGTGIGTEDLVFPAGVAVRLPAGSQLNMNLHLYNVTSATLTGTSAIEVLTTPAASVQNQAEALLAGKVVGLTVAPGTTTQTGRCTMPADVTLFAVGPHMHKLGTHLKATVMPAGGGTGEVLFDKDYSFESQKLDMLLPQVALHSGDKVQVDCTYRNDSPATIGWGNSSDAEMCFATLYRYPAQPAGALGFACIN
jgi:Copper type II ascorbate-dependent monooxygenase, C-terminal domain